MHSWIRSRIERCFAHFDKFRFFHGTDHDITWVKDAVQIVSVAVYGLLASEPQYDFDSEINVHLQNIDDSSFCWCSKGCGLVKPIDQRRDWLNTYTMWDMFPRNHSMDQKLNRIKYLVVFDELRNVNYVVISYTWLINFC